MINYQIIKLDNTVGSYLTQNHWNEKWNSNTQYMVCIKYFIYSKM